VFSTVCACSKASLEISKIEGFWVIDKRVITNKNLWKMADLGDLLTILILPLEKANFTNQCEKGIKV